MGISSVIFQQGLNKINSWSQIVESNSLKFFKVCLNTMKDSL